MSDSGIVIRFNIRATYQHVEKRFMRFKALLRAIFRFRKTNFSILLIITYAIIIALLVFDRSRYKLDLPNATSDKLRRNLLEQAWSDLQVITQSPHPYSSRNNDVVHDFLLQRVKNITRSNDNIYIDDDYRNKSSILFHQPDVFNSTSKVSRVVYYESSNIIVKVVGSNNELPALLISGHFDSVPTSYGATDDGKGIATMLSLLNHFSSSQPKRSVIFNFNNNEEFGLLGAYAFTYHPWIRDIEYFINLEGMGAGDRAVLFRTSNVETAEIYKKAVKSRPFGNSIFQQGFNSRYIRSQTDYKVYDEYGLKGWDISFYKPRDYYHTAKDSIQYTSKESLWSMLNQSLQLAIYISNEKLIKKSSSNPAVFFDLLGLFFVVVDTKHLFYADIFMLIVGPILLMMKAHLDKRRRLERSRLVQLRLLLSLGLSVVFLLLLTKSLNSFNPFVYSADYRTPLTGLFLLFVTVNYLIVTLAERLNPTESYKTVAINQIFIIAWLMQLYITLRMAKSDFTLTGTYPLSIFSGCLIVALSLGLFGTKNKAVNVAPNSSVRYASSQNDEDSPLPSQDRGEIINQVTDTGNQEVTSNTNTDLHSNAEEVDERMPLLSNNHIGDSGKMDKNFDFSKHYNWIVQFLCIVPISSFIFLFSLDYTLDAIHKMVQETTDDVQLICIIITIGVILLALPILPFISKLNYQSSVIIAIIGVLLFGKSLVMQPFSEIAPLKVRFLQTVNQHDISKSSVSLFTAKDIPIKEMIYDLPSVKSQSTLVNCTVFGGSKICDYYGLPPNLVDSEGNRQNKNLMKIEVLKNDNNDTQRSPYAPLSAEIKINVSENRVCSLAFWSQSSKQSPVKKFSVIKSNNNNTNSVSNSIKYTDGIDEVLIHKLDFDGAHHFSIEWLPNIPFDLDYDPVIDGQGDNNIEITVACFTGEADSLSVVNGHPLKKIPAFDEVVKYSPKWYTFTNRDRGLVVIKDKIQL